MGRIRRRLTYANVTATLALMFSMTGGAYALIISGAHVQDESLTGADVRNGSLGLPDLGVPVATTDSSGKVGNADKLDGRDSTHFSERRWVIVRADGTVMASSHDTVVVRRNLPGVYVVGYRFPDRIVEGCAFAANVSTDGADVPGYATVRGGAGVAFVVTHDQHGSQADRGFHLTITC